MFFKLYHHLLQLLIHILKLINTVLDHVEPVTVAHAYPLLPNMEIVFIGLTGMVVLVQVAVVFFYSTIIFMNKKV